MKDFSMFLELRAENLLNFAEMPQSVQSLSKRARPKMAITGSPSVAIAPSTPLGNPPLPKNLLSVFRSVEDYEGALREVDQLNRSCKNFDLKGDFLNELNAHVRNKFFVSDYEKSLFDFEGFWKLWGELQKNVKDNLGQNGESEKEVSWATWKQLKAQFRPIKIFSSGFIQQAVAAQLKRRDTVNITFQSFARSYYSECKHLHIGRIEKINEQDMVVTLMDRASNRVVHSKAWELKALPPTEESSSSQLQAVKHLDKRALAALILILRQKHIISRMMESNPRTPESQSDYEYLSKRIEIIDKHLANIVLKMRVSPSREFRTEDFKRQYTSIIAKYKNTFKRNRDTITDERLKPEIDLIISSLTSKQEAKIAFDVKSELMASLKMNQFELDSYLASEGKAASFELIKDCLEFLQQLNCEGDIKLDQNQLYQKIAGKFYSLLSPQQSFNFANMMLSLSVKLK